MTSCWIKVLSMSKTTMRRIQRSRSSFWNAMSIPMALDASTSCLDMASSSTLSGKVTVNWSAAGACKFNLSMRQMLMLLFRNKPKIFARLAAVRQGCCTIVITYRLLKPAKLLAPLLAPLALSGGCELELSTWRPCCWHAKSSSFMTLSGSCFCNRKSKPMAMPPSCKLHNDMVEKCTSSPNFRSGASTRRSWPVSRRLALTCTWKRFPGGATKTSETSSRRRFRKARTSEPLKPSRYRATDMSLHVAGAK
mmetsp:Transcript_107326/g.308850  ORF Transcript_107326/g.308850 Transcript_107326/m.308850 type:complete len:251 (+) Transcript_107326:768-1520(+)